MSTVTPGNTPPVSSRTVPVTVADVVVWPRAGTALNKQTIASQKTGENHFDRMRLTPLGGPHRPTVQRMKATAENARRGACKGSTVVRTPRFNVEEVLRAWRGRVGAGGTKDRGPQREAREITRHENIYGHRRARQRTEAARKRDKRGIGPGADRAHLAGALAFFCMMHRADLTGEQARAALFVVADGGHVLATERQRGGGEVRNLAQQPGANQPRQPASDTRHEHIQLSTVGRGLPRHVGSHRRGPGSPTGAPARAPSHGDARA